MTDAIKPPSEAYLSFDLPLWQQREHRIRRLMNEIGYPNSLSVKGAMSQLLRDDEYIRQQTAAALTANAPVGEPVAYIDPADLEYFKREIYADAEVQSQPRLSEDGRDYVPLYTAPVTASVEEVARAVTSELEQMYKDGIPMCMREGETTWRTYHAGFDLSMFTNRIVDRVLSLLTRKEGK